MTEPIPPEYAPWVERLSASAWRERKQAAEVLKELVERDRDDVPRLSALAAVLLDGLVRGEPLEGRAACHEVLVAIGSPGVVELVRRLETPGQARRLLVDLLGEIGDASHGHRLAAIVSDATAETNLRAAAAVAAGRLGGSAAHLALLRLLGEDEQMLQVHALDALRYAELAIPASRLEPLLRSPFTRKAATAVLGQSQDAAALPLLLRLVEDELPGVRKAAVRSVSKLCESLAATRPDWESLATQVFEDTSDAARGHVRGFIGHPDVQVRAAAIRMAGLMRDAEALPRVLEVMDDLVLQEEALTMVYRLGAAAGPAVAAASEKAGGAAREHLFRLVGALRSQLPVSLLSLLTGGLEEPSEEGAVAAAESLARVGDPSCLGPLYRAMGQPGRLGEAAADAVVAIVRQHRGEPALLAAIGRAWPDEGDLAGNLCRVAGQLGAAHYASHLVSLLGSPDVTVRVAAASALGKIEGEHEGPSALSFALTDEEPRVRAAACRSLGELRAPCAVQSLLSATTDRSPLVRAAAVQALVVLDNPVALARLRAVVTEDPVPTVVVQAIEGLGAWGIEQDLTMLMSLCTSTDWEVVKAAARALRGFRAHRATAAVLGLLGHERWDVRWAAAEVLGARADRTALEPARRALAGEPDRLVQDELARAIAEMEHAG